MTPVRIAVNGFGRIGRNVVRLAADDKNVQFVGINDLTNPNMLAHLFKYDSIFGPFQGTVEARDTSIVVNGREIPVFSEKDPAKLPWKQQEVDIVLECTGIFRDKKGASAHLNAGARKVIISAPGTEVDLTCVYGVNHQDLKPDHTVISNASCTTNCLVPIAQVLHAEFGIENGFMTTVHSYTSDQRLLDAPHSDFRRARAATLSQIPTSTGAARAVGLVLPELKGKLDGISIRVPTADVSCLDLTVNLKKSATADAINAALKAAAAGELKGVLRYCEEELVSADFLGDRHSSIIDAPSTAANGKLAKILAWYDNEVGFSCRMIDVAKYMNAL